MDVHVYRWKSAGRDRGKRLYSWADSAGVGSTKLRPPRHRVEFTVIHGEGFDVFQDVVIATPTLWKLVLKRVPVRRVEALYEGERPYYWIGTGS